MSCLPVCTTSLCVNSMKNENLKEKEKDFHRKMYLAPSPLKRRDDAKDSTAVCEKGKKNEEKVDEQEGEGNEGPNAPV